MEENSSKEPLLSGKRLPSSSSAIFAAPVGEAGDIGPIDSFGDFWREYRVECKKLWYLAGPAIFQSLCRYSLGVVTQIFVGQVGTLELAAVSIENSVIAGFAFGIMLGMGSALETLCGQAYGAGQLDMLGVYLQRSWVILNSTAVLLTLIYIFAGRLLRLIGQEERIATTAGKFAVWMLPQLFAYSMNFPMVKFLQAQRKMVVLAQVAGSALLLHVFFGWLLILRLKWGLVGAAVVLNSSWWYVVIVQLIYILGGACGQAWTGFSRKAFQNLWGFVRLSFASAVMLCLETWYYMALTLFAGYLKNAEVSVAGMSVCMNILGWAIMLAIGVFAATSVRVSNELGAGHPRTAKIAVVAAVSTSFLISLFISSVLFITQHQYPSAFTNSEEVRKLVLALTPLLAAAIIVNNVQPVLSGVAVGAGWQATVAIINIGCYYVFGVPLGLILGYKLKLGLQGICYGMLTGTIAQTLILSLIIYRTDWTKEVTVVGDRIRKWGGEPEEK